MLKIIAPASLFVLSLNSFAASYIPTSHCLGIDSKNADLAKYTPSSILNDGPNSALTVAPAIAGGGLVDRKLNVVCVAEVGDTYGYKLQVEIKGKDYHPTQKVECKAKSYAANGTLFSQTSIVERSQDGDNYTLKISADYNDTSGASNQIVAVTCSIPDRGPVVNGIVHEVEPSSISWIKVY